MGIVQGAVRGTVEVVELAAAESPEEAGEPEGAEQQRRGDQVDERDHPQPPLRRRCTRSAFAVTTSDEADITTAAMSGVTMPAIAIGTATRL